MLFAFRRRSRLRPYAALLNSVPAPLLANILLHSLLPSAVCRLPSLKKESLPPERAGQTASPASRIFGREEELYDRTPGNALDVPCSVDKNHVQYDRLIL